MRTFGYQGIPRTTTRNMCFEEKSVDTKERFVSRAIEKRVRNKRRRDPDMYMDVLLSSTVKRLKYELVNEQCQPTTQIDREILHISKTKDSISSSKSNKEEILEESEVIKAVECLQSTLESLDAEIRNEGTGATSTMEELSEENQQQNCKKDNYNSCITSVAKENAVMESQLTKKEQNESNSLTLSASQDDDVDFDTLMQSLLEICEPLTGNVDDLMKEYAIDPSNSGNFDFLVSSDPFLPGMFEVMCS